MNEPKSVLPPDPAAAVKHMTKLVDQLAELMDREAMALAKRDAISFAALQDEKNRLSGAYEKASAEFGRRLQEFRRVDGALIDRLALRQEDLRAKAIDSTRTMERMQAKSGKG